jgi:hypothetical protein
MSALLSAPEIVRRYFDLAAQPYTEAYFAQFAHDAIVEDEGNERRGIAGIRAWRASVPLVRYDVTNVAKEGDTLVVTATISGDFPGSPVTGLHFRFEDYDDRRIRVLRIRP